MKTECEPLRQDHFLVETLMESIPDHIYFKDLESRFIRINAAMARVFKLRDPAEAIGKTDFDFFAREHAQQAFNDEQQIIRTGKPLVSREEKETWPDGSVTWVSTSKQPLRDEGGNIIGTFGISRDITARKRVEEALAEKAQELARSNTELEQFAYVASHDLQEPLRMIASYLQLLDRRCEDKLDADGREFLSYAVDGAKRMQNLINDFLKLSRVGRQAGAFTWTDCSEALQQALAQLKVAIDASQASITSSPLPTVMGDGVQLTQLFQNLIANAIKFRRQEERPQIHISAQLSKMAPAAAGDPGTTEWLFAVRDNGIGIEKQYFERIFVIFQRLHARQQYPGTGIGLAMCKKIVERHGGRIWCESEPGQGTSFYFTVPHPGETPL